MSSRQETNAEMDRTGNQPGSKSGEWLEAWHVTPSLAREYDVIDGLRGVAILLVVACHLFYVNPAAGPAVQFMAGIFSGGSWGVTIFFTLSGFLISHPFWKRKAEGSPRLVPPGYFRRRFWKIYPPLALSVVLFTPVYIAQQGNIAFFLTLAGQWLAGWPLFQPVSGELNPVMWSLIVEVHFYILLPLLFWLFRRASIKVSLAGLFLSFLVVPSAFRWWHLSHGVVMELHPEINVHFPAMLDAFAFGVLVAGLEHLRVLPKSSARLGDVGCVLLVIAIVLLAWFNLYPRFDRWVQLEALTCLVKLASGLMLLYVLDPKHPRSRLLSAPWLRWFGLISYEWYLFHQPLILWSRGLFGPAGGDIVKYLTILGIPLLVGLAIAVIVYRYFSLPLLRYGRNRRGVL